MNSSTARLVKLATAGAATLVMAGFASVASASAAAPVNWGQDGFNKANSGYNAFETVIRLTPTWSAIVFSVTRPMLALRFRSRRTAY